MNKIRLILTEFENLCSTDAILRARNRRVLMEFHIRDEIRKECGLEDSIFSLCGNVILADIKQARTLAMKLNSREEVLQAPEKAVRAGQLNAMGLIDEILHYVVALYREQVEPRAFDTALERLEKKLGNGDTDGMLRSFGVQFPPKEVYTKKTTVDGYLKAKIDGESCRSISLEEILLLALANLNPAFRPFQVLFDDADMTTKTVYPDAIEEIKAHFAELPVFGPDGQNLWDLLRAPAIACPDSLFDQLEYMRRHWGLILGKFMGRLLTSLDIMKEEDKPYWGGPGPTQIMQFGYLENEYERFSPDQEWMPRTVLMAKSTLVWLFQLSQRYGREIKRLDEIPDEELDELARRGFTGLWLIGLWERSNASKTVKQWTGNPEAAASAYSLHDYDIAGELGGWGSLANLRERCFRRGIRLGSDMVPNHTGLDSKWIMEHPDRFLQLNDPPFPTYTFNGGNLSNRDGVGIYIDDHYYNRSDAAVVFKRVDFNSGHVRYIYHGNDGTSMPWNDTAQIDFLNPEAREAVIRTIIGVCQQFSIVRFDAAMTLAKRHIQRLWYPEPGSGGDIASRSEHAISTDEFNRRIPNEFWREVVDRCAAEAPHTLLLAEAFWMMEGYFVRTLGMHRVYNSAFMNMLKKEENSKYRSTIKNTLEFDPEVLKRFVNFMNNPDEDTAVEQFGKGDKYFGICTLLVTMPGLPMFGHGQIEGFEEKYGMEYRRSYRDETPDGYLVDRHEREIFPLMKKRYIFSGSADFCLYDLVDPDVNVNENVFAYSNRAGDEMALVCYNNSYYRASGWIKRGAVAIPQKDGSYRQDSLCEALSLHGEDRFFVKFREQRSGLWYLRSSKELAERGLFVGLNGYEAQVFTDICELEDVQWAVPGSWEGRWARLNYELNGRGVPDLEAALLDIYLGDLFTPFAAFFKPERMEQLNRFVEAPSDKKETEEEARNNRAKKAEFIDYFREPVLNFADAALKRLDGTIIGYEVFKPEDEKIDLHYKPNLEEVWNEFASYIKRLIKFDSTPANIKTKIFDEKTQNAWFIFGYGVVRILRSIMLNSNEAVRLADHWQLFRKLKECLMKLGVPEYDAQRSSELVRSVLVRVHPEKIVPVTEPDRIAAHIIFDNYSSADFRSAIGVNHFEDVTWFNKEAFEETLVKTRQFLVYESASALGNISEDWEKRLALIDAVTEKLLQAEQASGYRFDKMLSFLTGEEASGAAEPTEKKSAVKKTEAKKPVEEKPTEKKVVEKVPVEKLAEKKAPVKVPTPKKAVDKTVPEKKPDVEKPVEKKPAEKKSDVKSGEKKPAVKTTSEEKKTVKKAPVEEKPAEKKPVEKKTAVKKPADKTTTAKKVVEKKAVDKAPTEKKAAVKKTVEKKAEVKKQGEKKPAAKKTKK